LNDTLLFDKDRKTIGQLIRNSTKRSVIIIRSPELVQNQIKGDESLQCLIQVKTLFSEVDQQSLPSIQQFVKKAEAIFACGKGSPDGAVRSKNGYTNDQLASNNRSDRWTTFLETVDDPLKSLIKEAKRKFHRPIAEEAAELLSSCDSIPEELDLITANNTTGYKGVSPKSSVSGTRYAASIVSTANLDVLEHLILQWRLQEHMPKLTTCLSLHKDKILVQQQVKRSARMPRRERKVKMPKDRNRNHL